PLRIDSDAPGSLTTATVGAAPRGRPPGPSLRDFLATRLPEYMIPTAFVTLEAFPLTPSGKVDRRALATLEVELGSTAEFVAPRTAAEALVAGVFAELLGVPRVSVFDHFFDLGGHSLKATRLVSRLRAASGVELPLRAVFEAPTVEALAARLGAAPGASGRPFPRLAGDGPFALSFAQTRLWFLDRLEPGSAAYNLPAGVRLRGPLDPGALAAALGAVVARHETLRTRFGEGAGAPELWLTPVPEDLLTVVDLQALPAADRRAAAEREAAAEIARPFDLASGRLLRARLLVLGPEDHGLVLTQHHIASDGWSLAVLLGDLATAYRAQLAGTDLAWPPLPVRYVEFAQWQRDELADHLDEHLDYWRAALAGAPALLPLATDRPRPVQPSGRGGRVTIHLPAPTHGAARALAERSGATLFMVLLAAWQTLLARHAGVDDVVVGAPVAGRLRPEVEPLVGLFVNTLALRARLDGEPTFGALLDQVRDRVLGALAHQELPFERLVEELAPDRAAGHPPVFQVAFALQNTPEAPDFAGVAVEPLELAVTTAKFDLLLTLRESDRGLVGGLEFDAELFDPATAERFAERFAVLLDAAVTRPAAPWRALAWFSAAEREQVLHGWNSTAVEIPSAPIHRLFEEQARRTPDAPAVVADSERLTYAELDRRADYVAAELRARGVGLEVAVALALERSVDNIVATLGVLKAGGYFVPLDANYPEERLRFLLADSGARVLVAHEGLLAKLPAERPETWVVGRAFGGAGASAGLKAGRYPDVQASSRGSGRTSARPD
ncbi:MAG: condensation domain-containing protein, partial [Thermoanaerobaculia bacterium]|nr:condensation domain-containing protein [Thermoanaerobaculia bacterium]